MVGSDILVVPFNDSDTMVFISDLHEDPTHEMVISTCISGGT